MIGENKMKTGIAYFCSALALVMSGGALAQDNVRGDSGFYGGLAIGKAKAKLDTGDFTFNQAGVKERKDELDTAYKFFGGYQFSRYIAAELSYTDLGKFAYIYDASGIGLGEERLNYKAKSWATSAVGSIPMGSSGFSLLGRLGITYNFAERSGFTGDGLTVAATFPRPPASKHRFSPLWGVGVGYDFSPALGLRLEYEDYGKFGESVNASSNFVETGRAKIHMYSLNFVARF